MDKFVKLLNEAVEKTRLSKNEIIRLTQINRSTFFQILSEKRIPTDEQMRQICRVLQLSEKERHDLENAYELLKVGEVVWNSRRQIQNCFQAIRATEMALPYLSSRVNKPSLLDQDTRIEQGADNILYRLRVLLNWEMQRTTPEIDVFLPMAGRPILEYIGYLYQDYADKTICIRHLNQFRRSDVGLADGILEYFKTILTFVTSKCTGYEAYYYYDDSVLDGSMGVIYPYYIIMKDVVALLNADMTELLLVHDAVQVSAYQTNFEERLQQVHRLCCNFPGNTGYSDLSQLWNTGQNYYSYGACPSLIPYIRKEHMERYVREDVKQLVCSSIQYITERKREYAFFSVEAVNAFARTGLVTAYPTEILTEPISPADRKEILTEMKRAMTSDKSNDYLLNEKLCSIPLHWEICVAENNVLAIYEEFMPYRQVYMVDEKTLVNSFAQYFEDLKTSDCVLDKKSVAHFLEKAIALIPEDGATPLDTPLPQ